MNQDKKQAVVKTLLNKMFEIAGYPIKYEDLLGRTDEWYRIYTMTREQNLEWLEWGTNYIKKELRISKQWAKREMDMIDLGWGLRINEN